jgi:hypothetical protein
VTGATLLDDGRVLLIGTCRGRQAWVDRPLRSRDRRHDLGPADPGLRTSFARYDEDEIWAALSTTMDLFGEVSRRTCAALGTSFAPAVEEHARALVEQLRSTRPARSG